MCSPSHSLRHILFTLLSSSSCSLDSLASRLSASLSTWAISGGGEYRGELLMATLILKTEWDERVVVQARSRQVDVGGSLRGATSELKDGR